MPAPKDPVKLAEYKRQRLEVLKTRMASPEGRAKMTAWRRDPTKVKLQIKKSTAWTKDKEKVRRAISKRALNLVWCEKQRHKTYHFGVLPKEKRVEYAKRAWAVHSDLGKRATAWRRDQEKNEQAKQRLSETLRKKWDNDPLFRQSMLAKWHNPISIAKRIPKISGAASAAKRPDVRRKMSISHKLYWTEDRRKQASEKWTEKRKAEWRQKQMERGIPRRPDVFNTKIEVALQNGLHRHGIRFTTHNPLLGVCRPDIMIVSVKLAIFADGCFFHGCQLHCTKLDSPIVVRNKKADERQNMVLLANGWLPLRFWEHDIKDDLASVVEEIVKAYLQRHVQPLTHEVG